MVIDIDLIRAINSGHSFVFVGSGPSIAMGLPTWENLALEAIKLLDQGIIDEKRDNLDRYLKQKKYPEIFSIVEQEIGIETLVDWLGKILISKGKKGIVYEYLASWPFACYLTTNFDNALKEHLDRENVPVVVKSNTKADISLISSRSINMIFKIHGELSDPSSIVLTKEQYSNFQNSSSKIYWRDKIKSVLHMESVVIIGYSLSDSDFTDQLKYAKETFQPDKPVFMFATGFNENEIYDLYSNYNIRIIPYENSNGNHQELQRILKRYKYFIPDRNSVNIGREEVDSEEAELATSLYLFTHLRIIEEEIPAIVSAYSIIILKILFELTTDEPVDIQYIGLELKKRTHSISHPDPTGIQKAINYLQSNSYILVEPSTKYKISPRGKQVIIRGIEENKLVYEKFVQACKLFLSSLPSELTDEEIELLISKLGSGLTRTFRARGLEIARSVYLDIPVDLSQSTDLISIIDQEVSGMASSSLSASFVDLIIQVLLQPNNEMKEYLAVLSQGYFAYHALGYDKNCGEERIRLARESKIILDSNILIYLIAENCNHNDYARDLIKRAGLLKFNLITTERLITEIVGHAKWAYSKFRNLSIDKENFVLSKLMNAGDSINIFVEGFLRWSNLNSISTFEDYFNHLFGKGWEKALDIRINTILQNYGIALFKIEDSDNFDSENYFSRRDNDLCPRIKEIRERNNTYKSEDQCMAEAEAYIICEDNNAKFLSLSTILNDLEGKNITWRPEAFYRFISMFTYLQPESNLLYSSLTQDFIAAGITILDKNLISQILKPEIQQARMQLEQQRDNYERELGEARFKEIIDNFDKVPDEQKPFYSIQIAHLIATKEREKRILAERRVADVQANKKLTDQERLEYEKLKGKKEQKNRDKLRRNRARRSRKKK